MPGYVSRNQVAVGSAVQLGRALVDIVSYCADEDVPLSERQRDLVAGCLMWAYHRMQQEADSGVRHVPAVRVQPSDSLRRLVLDTLGDCRLMSRRRGPPGAHGQGVAGLGRGGKP